MALLKRLSNAEKRISDLYAKLRKINTGGSGVQSVSGDTVDNTDPLNPVIEIPNIAQVLNSGDSTRGSITFKNLSDTLRTFIHYAGITISNITTGNQTSLIPTGVKIQNDTLSGGGVTNLKASPDFDVVVDITFPARTGTVALLDDIPVGGTPALEPVLTVGSHVTGFKEITFGDGAIFNESLASTRSNRFGYTVQGGVDFTNLGGVALHSPGGSIDPYIEYTKVVDSVFQSLKIKVEDIIATNLILQYTNASGKIPTLNTTAPSSATATGYVGEIRVTSTFIYVCIATNTWVRSAALIW